MSNEALNVNVYVGDIASSAVARGENDGASGAKGKSWLVAIAQAMGNALGTKAAKLVELSNKLDGLAGYVGEFLPGFGKGRSGRGGKP